MEGKSLIGTTIAQYRVEAKLGEGGMGVVYRAHDTRLNRDVALKFLPESLQQDETARKRFLREAESAAALEHPYICNIKEVSHTDDGHDFIVMEYVEGQTLQEKLEEGPLSLPEATRIAVEVTDALQLAHERGIVHRDLKPSNVMLTPQGHAKVMDFGLAKRVSVAGGEQEITASLTREGSTLGTLAYMSPEQLKGSAVDTRSDIFSFGIVLYEMLTAVHPFRRGQSMGTVGAILAAEAEPLRLHRRDIPELLEQTVLKMLRKTPQERFQSVQEVGTCLSDPTGPWRRARWSIRPIWGLSTLMLIVIAGVILLGWWAFWGGPIVNSIAVLPLDNLSGDPEQEYFADGMSEALITDLSKISALKVISRTSAMRYKGTDKSVAEIARELGVEALLEGSVIREGGRVRISAQLIEAETGRSLWAERYERNLTSILALQGEIAQAIARQIETRVTRQEESRLTRTRDVNPEAYEAYLKGRSAWSRLTVADLDAALRYFRTALEKDPDYAPGHVGVAMVWLGRRQMGLATSREAGPKVKKALQKALQLDENLAEAHYVLAADKGWNDWDWEGAETAFRRALELNPNHAEARALYSGFLGILKRHEEGVPHMERALELDPFNTVIQSWYSFDQLAHGRVDDAIEAARKAVETTPNHLLASGHLILALYAKGMDKEAVDAYKAWATAAGDRKAVEILEQGYVEGGPAEAMKRLADWGEAKITTSAYDICSLYAMAGANQQALDLMERLFEKREPNMPAIGVDPTFAGLRKEPRFQNLLRRLNFPEDVLARYLEDFERE